MSYDSTPDTEQHIARVRKRIFEFTDEMVARAYRHDLSKYVEPEKSAIDRVRPQLKQLEFGTPEYKELKRAFSDHHYKINDHHLEYFENGIEGMGLLQIVEMLCDWKAATETHGPDDNIYNSIDIICKQHEINDTLKNIFVNTAKQMGW